MIIYRDGVKKTAEIEAVIDKLQVYFEHDSIEVTSGLRDIADQYRIIYNYAIKYSILTKYIPIAGIYLPEPFEGKEYPLWQLLWSYELEKGLTIAPPVPAMILTGVKKGQLKNPSPHISGTAFDLVSDDLIALYGRMVSIKKIDIELDKIITQILNEPINACIHIVFNKELVKQSLI